MWSIHTEIQNDHNTTLPQAKRFHFIRHRSGATGRVSRLCSWLSSRWLSQIKTGTCAKRHSRTARREIERQLTMFSQKFGNWMHDVAQLYCVDLAWHVKSCPIWCHKTTQDIINIIQRPPLFSVCFTLCVCVCEDSEIDCLPSQWIRTNPPHRICTTPHHWSRRHGEGR